MNYILEDYLHTFLAILTFYWFGKIPVEDSFKAVLFKHFIYFLSCFFRSKLYKILYLPLFALYLLLPDSITEALLFVLQVAVALMHYSPSRIFLCKRSIFRIIQWVLYFFIISSQFENIDIPILLFESVNIEILYQAWVLCRELKSFTSDFKEGKETGAILLGRYDSYRVFTLLQIWVYALILLDVFTKSVYRAIPLLFIPWTCYFVFKIRNMKMNTFPVQYFFFAGAFTMVQMFLSRF
ncbi:hypothetical protein SteCoe_36054 [Stentor coeruleus]|uniref:Uncharacterized protein n=1 Tax=Stentor coeruleus TaxID=5963 RepID=A0A1R2AQX0_9CILI|nr:hypothetical protein SteCoe_36054 [Stentor coeruleus]